MKQNVLLIIPYLTDGGAERVVSELSFALAKNFNVFILLYEDRVTYPFAGQKIILNHLPKYVNSLLRNLALTYYVQKIKKEYCINYSISFLVSPNLINVLSKRGDRVILTVHTHLSEYYKRKTWMERLWNKIILNFIYNRANNIVAVSREVEDDLIENFGLKKNKLTTIYNFYDYDKVRDLANADLSTDHFEIFKKPVVINIGRLTYSKGQSNLLKAFKKVRQKQDVNLVILGDGKYRDVYLHLIKMYELESSVFLLGFQSNPYAFIKRSSMLVSASKFEGLSNVILEAIGLGIPVISTDCKSGPREILAPTIQGVERTKDVSHHQYGVLLPVAHPENINIADDLSPEEEAMAKAITMLLEDPDIRRQYSVAGLARSDYFNLDNQISKWIKLLDYN